MAEIDRIDTVVPEPPTRGVRRVVRKDEDLSEEERQRLLRRKRLAEKRKQEEEAKDESDGDGEHEVSIRV